jgi:predicted branched-subunit amino acid permease
MRWDEVRAGARVAAPMLVGVIPFGLVAGASPVAAGMGLGAAMGFSAIVFAGASQLGAIDVLADGGSALVAAAAAWMINLRLVLYSASLAPYLAHEPLRRRLLVSYLLVDQAYAAAIGRWTGEDDIDGRVPFFLGGAVVLAGCWLAATAVGALVGTALPDDVPLDFAVPLVFLVLLVPLLVSTPAVVAAGVGGAVTVVALELGAGHLSLMAGATAGIVAGAVVDRR